MIQSSELRIGNYISYKGNAYKVTLIGITTIDVDGKFLSPDNDQYQSIEINPELLKKCGFNKDVTSIAQSYTLDKLSLYFSDGLCVGEWGRTYFNSWVILEHIPKYLHQLQNLYYSLTGKELTVNL